MRIAEWIIDNLNEYGNCALPNKLIKLYGIRQAEKEITELAGYPVLIEERTVDSYAYSAVATLNTKRKKEKLYIAVRL